MDSARNHQNIIETLPGWVAANLFSEYCTFSFKSTGGVTRDPFYLFDISAAAEFLRDTSKISAFEPKILPFLPFFLFFLGNLGPM
jgi:hypothetical protein